VGNLKFESAVAYQSSFRVRMPTLLRDVGMAHDFSFLQLFTFHSFTRARSDAFGVAESAIARKQFESAWKEKNTRNEKLASVPASHPW
jgi:hypothetical protein